MATNNSLTTQVTNAIEQDGGYSVYAHYGHEPTNRRTIRSPFREDKNPSFSFYQSTKTGQYNFKDFATEDGGDAIEFVKLAHGIGFYEAIKEIAGIYGISRDKNFSINRKEIKKIVPQKPKPTPKTVRVHPREWLSLMANHDSPFHAFAKSLGIPAEHLERWNIGTDKKGNTVFGMSNEAGDLVNYKLVHYQATGKRSNKIRNEPEFTSYATSKDKNSRFEQCLYGLHLLDRLKPVALVESEKTAFLASWLMPEYNWLATGGANSFGDKLKALDGTTGIVLFDADNAGRDGAKDACKRLGKDYKALDLWPELEDKRDLADAIADGATAHELQELIANAKDFTPEPEPLKTHTKEQYKSGKVSIRSKSRTIQVKRYVNSNTVLQEIQKNNITAITAPTGSGKTKATVKAAHELKEAGLIDRIIYVSPYGDLCHQTANSFNDKSKNPFKLDLGFEVLDGLADIELRRWFNELPYLSTTYASFVARVAKTLDPRTLVILDEWHECFTKPFDAQKEILPLLENSPAKVAMLSGTPFKEWLDLRQTPELFFEPKERPAEKVQLVNIETAKGKKRNAELLAKLYEVTNGGDAGKVYVHFSNQIGKDNFKAHAKELNKSGRAYAYVYATDTDVMATDEVKHLIENKELLSDPNKPTHVLITGKGYAGLDIENKNIGHIYTFGIQESKDVKQALGRFRNMETIEATCFNRWISEDKDRRIKFDQFKHGWTKEADKLKFLLGQFEGLEYVSIKKHSDRLREDVRHYIGQDGKPNLVQCLRDWNEKEKYCTAKVFARKLQDMGIECTETPLESTNTETNTQRAKATQKTAKDKRESLYAHALNQLYNVYAHCLQLVQESSKCPETRLRVRELGKFTAVSPTLPYEDWKKDQSKDQLESILSVASRWLYVMEYESNTETIASLLSEHESDYKYSNLKYRLRVKKLMETPPEKLDTKGKFNRQRYSDLVAWIEANPKFTAPQFKDAYKAIFKKLPKDGMKRTLEDLGKFNRSKSNGVRYYQLENFWFNRDKNFSNTKKEKKKLSLNPTTNTKQESVLGVTSVDPLQSVSLWGDNDQPAPWHSPEYLTSEPEIAPF